MVKLFIKLSAKQEFNYPKKQTNKQKNKTKKQQNKKPGGTKDKLGL